MAPSSVYRRPTMTELRRFVVAIVLLLFPIAAHAEPLDPKAVPEPLRPWTAWALAGKADGLCPTLHGHEQASCAWPSRLELTLDEKRGTFRQSWHVDAKRWVALPGDDKRWPLDVTVDGKRSVVLPREGVPSIELEAGDHTVTGAFAWDSLPESLQVPAETALLDLVLRGKAVAQPNRDPNGTLWLQKTLAAEEGERLDFVVHRRIVDDVPLQLTTRIVINVAGRNREVLLGRFLPKGFVPMAMDSQLPARIEADTRLRVQARPGTWTIEVVARSEGPVAEIERPQPDGPWRDGEEVWVFEARADLRLVDVEGANAIDPQQTTLPEAWKRLPAYPVALGTKLRLVEKRRGDAEPPPDRLSLERSLWLDFDGRGFTAIDTLSGSLHRASRLEMLPPTVLGRVSIDGKDQFITHLDGDAARTGVEVRQGELRVTADSRVHAVPSDVPAVGWNHDFHSVTGTLHLPPGFRLLHASGVDDVASTWIKHWTLFELFLALVLTIGVARLYGARWGAVALATFVTTFPEDDAPKYVFVLVLLCEALFRATRRAFPAPPDLPSRGLVRAERILRGARAIAGTALVLLTIVFVVDDVRHGLFPALDAGATHGAVVLPQAEPVTLDAPASSASAPPPREVDSRDEDAEKHDRGAAKALHGDYKQFNARVYDPSSMVQTGPGRPRWSFTEVPLHWNGPVERSQRLHLYLLSPAANALLAILRALLLGTIAFCLLPIRPRRGRGEGGKSILTFAAAAILLLPRVAHAEVPPKEVLDELAARMLEKPSCSPSCASSSRMAIDARGSTLRLRMEIEASAKTAVPLPTSAQWSPQDVLVDGKPASALMRTADGKVWVAVEKGWHQLVAGGPLPDRELVQLALPLKPHRVEAQAEGWRVEGLHEDGLSDDNLQLTRIRAAGADGVLEPSALPPFVRVERTILIGLDWQVETRVVRLSPPGSAIVLEVPLLRGESVTTADVRVAAGKAQLNMPPQATETTWRSVLDRASPIVLTAPKSTAWSELWRLDISPIWHADASGIPVVHADAASKLSEWRPWPGESATLKISRPDGVVGGTLTIDESLLALRPGLRATDATLTMQVRSSRGGQHTIGLPDGAVLESVTISGETKPIRQDGMKVTIPVTPGSQSIVVHWRSPAAMTAFFRAPPVDLGAPNVNATTTIAMAESRWILGLRGPDLGPVVLFWSLLLVLFAVSAGIGAMRRTPLATWQWILLAIGLSQVHVVLAAFVVGWFHLVASRERTMLPPRTFNLRQVAIVIATVVAVVVLVVAIHRGLLGQPEMQVRGNFSSPSELRWFTDRSEGVLSGPVVISAPMFVYRLAMLAWALWLALSLVKWLRWAWGAFGTGGFWLRMPRPTPPPAGPHRTPPDQLTALSSDKIGQP
jgi:hypothetical protein